MNVRPRDGPHNEERQRLLVAILGESHRLTDAGIGLPAVLAAINKDREADRIRSLGGIFLLAVPDLENVLRRLTDMR